MTWDREAATTHNCARRCEVSKYEVKVFQTSDPDFWSENPKPRGVLRIEGMKLVAEGFEGGSGERLLEVIKQIKVLVPGRKPMKERFISLTDDPETWLKLLYTRSGYSLIFVRVEKEGQKNG